MSSLQPKSIFPARLEPLSPIVKPFVKWVGGKQALANQFVRLFPQDIKCFFEPFVGGGSVFLSYRPTKAVICDSNRWLVDTYKAVRDDWEAVTAILDRLLNTKEEYLRIRAIQPSTLDPFHRAAHMIYLNKTCFRGLYRVNRKGQFNVPYGGYNRRYYDPHNLKKVSTILQETVIRSGDFEPAIFDITSDDFVYFDPPYYKLGGYSDFNRYTGMQFRQNDHLRLASLCRELDSEDVRWAVSNSDTGFVRHLFDGYNFQQINARREINLDSKQRDIRELLITNY